MNENNLSEKPVGSGNLSDSPELLSEKVDLKGNILAVTNKYKVKPAYLIAVFLLIAISATGGFWYLSKHYGAPLSDLASNSNSESNTNTPPEAAISACTGKAVGDTCEFTDRKSLAKGTCDDKPGVLACKREDTLGGVQEIEKGATQTTGAQKASTTPTKTGQNQSSGQSGYSIEQAISDQAQLNTLAFGGLGFITGNTCSDSFLPPGKVADFFGFQYLRDVTQSGKGHSTDFVTNAANNVLKTLTTEQKAKMIALAKTQATSVNDFAYKRFPLMVAFRRLYTGDIPAGTSGLSKTAVMQYSADLYQVDAKISLERAKLFAEIIRSLSTSQKTFLDGMVKGGFASWASLSDQVDKKSLTHDEHVLVMTYASEMFGWYAGNVEADTYFCPERQGDYFGGFYIKDAPAMGNAGYTIDESITGDKGEAFINALSSTQKPIITSIVETQRSAINGIVEIRRAIATELRKALSGGTINEASVYTLAKEYGQLDGEISYYYATAFSQVGKSLTSEQKAKLISIKDLDDYVCDENKAYLYSEKINMPIVANTDFLFK